MSIPWRDRNALIVASCILLGVAIGSVAYLYSDKAQEIVQPTIPATAPADMQAIDGPIDAILRTWRITDACYDQANNVYLVKIADHKHEDGQYDQGWYLLDTFKFIKLQNGTYVIRESGALHDIEPDITGLRCKQQVLIWAPRAGH